MVYVTKADGNSFMHVYNAKTMDAKPVAEVSAVHAPGPDCAGTANTELEF